MYKRQVNEKTRVVSEEKEEVDISRKEFLPQLNNIKSLIRQMDEKLEICENNLSELGKSISKTSKDQVNAVSRVRDKLKQRANVIEHMLESNQIEKIDEAKKKINEPLTFPVDSVNELVSTDVLEIPDIPKEKWESTVKTMLENLNQELTTLNL